MAKPTILIIEDDTLLVQMYKTKFTSEGFDVLVAGDGVKGLEMIKTYHPHCIIMDIMMPKLSGMQLLEMVKQDPVLAKIPVIMMSNLSQPSEIERAKKLGVKEFLIKANYTPSQIVEIIKRCLI